VNYYNEHDPFAAAWLGELITAGAIPDGYVDTRDIQTVTAGDLAGFVQCHFFAGIGGWALALEFAGWPSTRPVWTGSCPCQPFSAAGKREGGNDSRHLWPYWSRLIGQCRPVAIFGEQVAGAIAHGWLDAVFDDLEGMDYACGSACVPACGVGAFHIRQRLYFVADARRRRPQSDRFDLGSQTSAIKSETPERQRIRPDARPGGDLGDADEPGPQRRLGDAARPDQCPARPASLVDLGDADEGECQARRVAEYADVEGARGSISDGPGPRRPWDGAIWIDCRDGKRRPTQPGLQPLAHGVSARVGRLRGYGNAIVPQVAAEVIRAYLECHA